MAEIKQPLNPKTLEIALVGCPNAGKSSLLNAILKSQISAVSPKANTTYEDILGIYTNNNIQLLIHDTPGITKAFKNSKHYITKAWEVLNEVEKAVIVVDCVKSIDDKIKNALFRLNKISYN